jgi:hypothetical protein
MAFQLKQIIAWDNSVIPDGWAICNGQTVGSITTPDLRDIMVCCTNTALEVGTTSGSATHSHSFTTVSTGNSPAHSDHGINASWDSSGTDGNKGTSGTGTSNAPSHNHTASISVSNNTTLHTHNISGTGTASNMPRHIKLLFIMKVA